jgi:hypothetical protein
MYLCTSITPAHLPIMVTSQGASSSVAPPPGASSNIKPMEEADCRTLTSMR